MVPEPLELFDQQPPAMISDGQNNAIDKIDRKRLIRILSSLKATSSFSANFRKFDRAAIGGADADGFEDALCLEGISKIRERNDRLFTAKGHHNVGGLI